VRADHRRRTFCYSQTTPLKRRSNHVSGMTGKSA